MSLLFVLFLKTARDVFEAFPVLYGVKTTLGWPICLGFDSMSNEKTEAWPAIVVASQSNEVSKCKIVKA